MNKIARYLNEHLLGEVSGSRDVRKQYATDGSVLTITPEVVAFPRTTNDIRKIARFTWQLAEKGHVIGLTARGLGNDTTGAAIGKGVVIDLSKHLTSAIHISAKDRIVHVQPGIRIDTLQQTLKWQGLALAETDGRATIGGIISSDTQGTAHYISDSVEKLEVILANGDILETGKLNKREVSKKLGLQTFEGEIYRKLEGLIEDNQELLDNMKNDDTLGNTGYRRLANVRQKDGSFDLTPLFIGSQGTLGIISEIVLKAEFMGAKDSIVVIKTDSVAQARDISDQLRQLEPGDLTILDGKLFERASKDGASFSVLGNIEKLGALVYLRLIDFSERTQSQKLKKLKKLLKNKNVEIIDSLSSHIDDFRPIRDIIQTISYAEGDKTTVPVIDGAFIPDNRREEFERSLKLLANKHHIDLPVVINCLSGTYKTLTEFKLDVVSEKQKLFKIIGEYAALVSSVDGAFVSDGAEGRLKSSAAWSTLDEEEVKLFEDLRKIFDPFGTLNPGVKQKNELRSLVALLRSTYSSPR